MRYKMLKSLVTALLVMTLQAGLALETTALAGVPGSTSPINLEANGVAIGGYDPVAYFESGKPTRGIATISESYDGARYLFASEAHRQIFLKNPKMYIPEFGGFCVVGTSHGEKVDVDPETGRVVNGKLYLNNGKIALLLFNMDRKGTINKAEGKWSSVKDKPL